MTRSNAPAYLTGFGNHFATEAAARRHPKGEKAVRRLPDRFRPEIEKKWV